jgi:formylglycine-generating enzyme required for sulfatase activity
MQADFTDNTGRYNEFAIGDAVQRLRWIPPGSFWMGSPEDEPEHYDDEGPRHEVTITSGFWMMDTPVRQCLWQAVMGNNPSEFKGLDKPVESVSWVEAQEFLSRLNDRIPGLELSLPSEAQWEYACRAGSGAENLDQIAWWSDNSGQETHPVGLKQANDFGLFDMLGNVWEWCADPWHDNYDGAPTDGSAWIDGCDAAAYRVMRGGAWGDDAGLVRAAYRGGGLLALRDDDVGFRCVRVQS